MPKNFFKNVLLFFIIFMIINTGFNLFFGEKEEALSPTGEIILETKDTNFAQGEIVSVKIINNTVEPLTIKNECPEEPLNIFKYDKGEWLQIHSNPKISCADMKDITIHPTKEATITYSNWNYALFGELGRYKLILNYKDKTSESNEFMVKEAGVFRLLGRKMLYQPIYNTLLYLSSILWNNLGLGIILLTFILRLILIVPSQRALKQQRRMQLVQPKLEAIKKRHKGDQQRIAQETMAIWKEHKVNPFGSCMPLLIQFPILIALFYVVQDGLNPDNIHLLYEPFRNINLTELNTDFLGILELTKKNIFWLPLIIGALQFIQMKLAMAKKKTDKKEVKSEMAVANNMMLYFMPVMVAVFAASLPAGVGLYWGASTVFGIGQQFFVNKEVDSGGSKDVKVKVKNIN